MLVTTTRRPVKSTTDGSDRYSKLAVDGITRGEEADPLADCEDCGQRVGRLVTAADVLLEGRATADACRLGVPRADDGRLHCAPVVVDVAEVGGVDPGSIELLANEVLPRLSTGYDS